MKGWCPDHEFRGGTGIGRAAAIELGSRFGQNAVVVGRRGGRAELALCTGKHRASPGPAAAAANGQRYAAGEVGSPPAQASEAAAGGARPAAAPGGSNSTSTLERARMMREQQEIDRQQKIRKRDQVWTAQRGAAAPAGAAASAELAAVSEWCQSLFVGAGTAGDRALFAAVAVPLDAAEVGRLVCAAIENGRRTCAAAQLRGEGAAGAAAAVAAGGGGSERQQRRRRRRRYRVEHPAVVRRGCEMDSKPAAVGSLAAGDVITADEVKEDCRGVLRLRCDAGCERRRRRRRRRKTCDSP